MNGFKNLEEKIIYHMLKGEYEIKYNGVSMEPEISKNIAAHNSYEAADAFTEIEQYINIMQATRENPVAREIVCYKKYIGKIIVWGKRIARRLLKFYIEPNTLQQNQFNSAVTPAIGKLTETVFTQKDQIDEVQRKLSDLMNETEQIKIENEQIKIVTENLKIENEQIKIETEQIKIVTENLKIENEQIKLENEHLKTENEEIRKIYSLAHNQINQNTEKLDKLNDLELDIFKEKAFNLFEKKSFSQSGEDTICAYILYIEGIPYEECTYLDLGANHAKDLSNTFWFYTKGARGVLVEANSELIPELKFYRNGDVIINKCVSDVTGDFVNFYVLNGDGLSTPDLDAANSFIEKNSALEIVDTISVETITVNDIIENYMGKTPVILNIDIEGKDMEIIKTINFDKYRPFIIIAEMIEYEKNIVTENKNNEIIEFLRSKNYIEYAFTGINSIFVDKTRLKKGE